jgi:hypothetical protein
MHILQNFVLGMRMKRLALVAILFGATGVTEAAPFQNLGFDDADTNKVVEVITGPVPYVLGRAQDFLPGWQRSPPPPQEWVGIDQFPEFQIGYGYATLFADHGEYPPVEGRFSLDLFADGGSPWTLSQTGDIPLEARTVNFLGYNAHFALSLNNIDIPLVYVPHLLVLTPLGLPPGYSKEINDVYGDISAFAGKTVTLKLTTLIDPNSALEPDAGLDSIRFVTFPSKLAVNLFGKRLVLTWPTSMTNAVLESTDSLGSTANWQTILTTPTVVGADQIVSTNAAGAARFFRLRDWPVRLEHADPAGIAVLR